MIEVGTNIMYLQQEYKITYLNNKDSRVIIEPIGEVTLPLQLNERITIDKELFIVTYINEGKKRISLTPIK